jgi:hypothetical protein
VLRIEVREFPPPDEELATDDKGIFGTYGRPMYTIPWAAADPDIELQKLEEAINPFVTIYTACILDDTDHLVWDVFEMAMRPKDFPKPVSQSRKVASSRAKNSSRACFSKMSYASGQAAAL